MSQDIEIERRLAAVLAADVAGFSRLTEADEIGTLRMLAAQRTILDAAIARHRGRIANTAGDSVLAEFPSAVNAVQCAVEAQQALRDAAEGAAENRRVLFRIGIHVGDVMVRNGDLLGSGINVAARLEGLADAGGIVLSAAAHEQVKKVLPLAYSDLGPQNVKNIEEPVRAFAIGKASRATAAALDQTKPLPLPEKPSIAVLPFQNMSGDPEQEYFADGMVEDIITALSRFKSLFVIARNSSFTYKGKAADIKQVGRELGVRYVLEGSVRKAGGRVRITGQLIEAATGAHLWADKFDGALEDVFDLQDQVTRQAIGAIAPMIERAEMERVRTRPTQRLDAYDRYMRGLAAVSEYSREGTEAAIRYYLEAVGIDPNYAAAHGRIAMATHFKRQNGWWTDKAFETHRAVHHARKAVQFGSNDAIALADGATALAFFEREIDSGLELIGKALELNSNASVVWLRSGMLQMFTGNFDTSLEHIGNARRLSPLDPQMPSMMSATANALMYGQRYAEALSLAERVVQQWPTFVTSLRTVAVSAAHLGNLTLARQFAGRLRSVDPEYTISRALDTTPNRAVDQRARMAEGLRLAGIPE